MYEGVFFVKKLFYVPGDDMALTDTWLRANLNKRVESAFEVSDRDGMSARVSSSGKIVFQVRFTHNKKRCRMDIGVYPVISLKQARESVIKIKADIAEGHDPRLIKKSDKDKNISAITLKLLFDKWYESYCLINKKNHEDIKRSFEIHVFPKIGSYPVNNISTDSWVTLLEFVTVKAPGIAGRLLLNGKQMLSWATRRKLIAENALIDITSKADLSINKTTDNRSLSNDEIRMLLICLDESKIAEKNKIFIMLCLIYGCRGGELRLSKKSDFDFEKMVWTVPVENHKLGKSTGKPLIRPITDYTKKFINEAIRLSKSDYLFNNGESSSGLSRGALISMPYIVMQFLRREKDYEMDHWSMHDLRKTARTNFSTLTQPHIAEIMLGHKMPGHWMVYDQHNYLEEQAECLIKWEDRLNEFN